MVPRSLRRGAAFRPFGFLLATVLSAQDAPPLNTTTWTSLGPAPLVEMIDDRTAPPIEDAGRVVGIATHPTDANTIYVAAAHGGVWKTIDGGASWVPLTDTQATLSMGAIALAPSNPLVIYAGTGEANESSDSNYGRGVLVSIDGGTTWTLRTNGGAFERRTVAEIAADPTQAEVAYVAVSARGVNGLSGNTGIWKTTDGGATWTNTTRAITSMAAWSSVAVDPGHPATVYGAVGETVGSADNGVYKSTDGGAIWTKLGGAPSGTAAGRIVIAVSTFNPLVIYVSAQGTGSAGSSVFGSLYRIMRSDDGGVTFTDLTAGTPNYMGEGSASRTTLVVDPANPAIVMAGGPGSSPIRSTDSGVTWTNMEIRIPWCCGSDIYTSLRMPHYTAAFDAAGRYLDGNPAGIHRLDTSASRWTQLDGNLSTHELRSIAVSPTNASYALASGTLVSRTGGRAWEVVDFGDGLVEVSQTRPARVYHQAPGFMTGFFRRSDGGGPLGEPTWVSKVTGITDNTTDLQNAYAPFVVDPGDGDRVLYGARHLWETANGGDSWTALGEPFPANVGAIGLSPSDPATIYAYAGGTMYFTDDHGATWTVRTAPPGGGTVNEIHVDPTVPLTAYAVLSSFNGGNGTVFRTTDGFQSWQNISGNLPDMPTWSLQLDASTPGTLYIGTDIGVYKTTDGGLFWNRFGSGLPNVQVFQIKLNTTLHVLAAATYGRGLWEILVSSAPTLVASQLTASWTGIASPSATDWIALYQVGAPGPAYLDWIYVSCSKTPGSASESGSCPFVLPAGLASGSYELRLLADDGPIVLATSNPLKVIAGQGPTLTASPAAPAGTVAAAWSGIVAPSPADWIGLYQIGASNATYLDWIYVSCAKTPGSAKASGSCPFVLPVNLAPGSYQLRLLADNGFTDLARSNTVTVPGLSLSASPSLLLSGGTLTAAWTGIASPSSTDWIGLYRPGAAAAAYVDWIYVSCVKTPGSARAAGSCPFELPANLASGSYQLRLLANDGFTVLATSNSVTVTRASLSASPASVVLGGTVTATWNNVVSPSPTDWIGLYPPGAPDTAYADWMYVSCTKTPGTARAAGSCSFVVPGNVAPGVYELRLFGNDAFTVLGTSNAFTVSP